MTTEKITGINVGRLAWSCHERGVDLAQLSAATQIAERTLSHAFDGKGLTFSQLQKLAKYFNRGVLFFLEPGEPEDDQLYSRQFRTLANKKPDLTPKVRAIIQLAEWQRDIYIALREELGEPVPENLELPMFAETDPAEAGQAARRWLQLAERNTFESYRRAVEDQGILVFRSNGYSGAWQIPKSESIEGFCLFSARCPVIVVKKQEAESRQVFTLFHELGHLLLHHDSYIDEQSDIVGRNVYEQEANRFAGVLLVPDSALAQIDLSAKPRNIDSYDDWLRPQRSAWAVSGEVILRRLLETKKLSKDEYENYRSWRSHQSLDGKNGGTRQYRHREPIHLFGAPFARIVLEALSQRRITSNKASRYLDNLKIHDLRQLEAYLATH